jgi:hypothetical protein
MASSCTAVLCYWLVNMNCATMGFIQSGIKAQFRGIFVSIFPGHELSLNASQKI